MLLLYPGELYRLLGASSLLLYVLFQGFNRLCILDKRVKFCVGSRWQVRIIYDWFLMSMKNAKYCILGRIFQLLVFLEYWISCFELSFSFYHNVLMQLYLYTIHVLVLLYLNLQRCPSSSINFYIYLFWNHCQLEPTLVGVFIRGPTKWFVVFFVDRKYTKEGGSTCQLAVVVLMCLP